MSWELPSSRIRALIRAGAEIALNAPGEWTRELNEATLGGPIMAPVAADPVLAASSRRTIQSNLRHWAVSNIRDPGERVPANVDEDLVAVARDLVRRGLHESSLDAYRIGQGVAVQLWIRIAFSLTSDPAELHELIGFSVRSITAFVDDTVEAIYTRMQHERAELTSGTHAERREVVALLLDGSPIPQQRAEMRLRYPLSGGHTAAIVWSDDPKSDLAELDRAAESLAGRGEVARALTVIADSATRWVWLSGCPDLTRAAEAVAPTVRVAIGTTAAGLDGFRRSHLDALTTQRMLARLSSARRIATYDDVEVAALITQETERADHFVRRTLGELEHAAADITDAVRGYIAEECNVSRTAARLFTHRNTVIRRLARADQLLPVPLSENVLRVGVALEIVRWRVRKPIPGTLREEPASPVSRQNML